MNIVWSAKTIVFSELDELIANLLRQLPECAETDDAAARSRIYSTPTRGADEEMDDEWREHVEPGLRELFASHTGLVRADLATLTDCEHATLTVPTSHAAAWVHTLNQARLTLAARHGITEADMEGERPPKTHDTAFALLQIEIYGAILGLMLQNTEI